MLNARVIPRKYGKCAVVFIAFIIYNSDFNNGNPNLYFSHFSSHQRKSEALTKIILFILHNGRIHGAYRLIGHGTRVLSGEFNSLIAPWPLFIVAPTFKNINSNSNNGSSANIRSIFGIFLFHTGGRGHVRLATALLLLRAENLHSLNDILFL